MPRTWDDEYDQLEDEGPLEQDLDDEDSADYDTVPCPACGAQISELAERCPVCDDWIVPTLSAPRRPLVRIIAVVLALLMLAWLLLRVLR